MKLLVIRRRSALLLIILSLEFSFATSELNTCWAVFYNEEMASYKCVFQKNVKIRTKDSRIGFSSDTDGVRNTDIYDMAFVKYNKNIKYLPIFVFEVFPNLRRFYGENLAIEEIRKENFVNLRFSTLISLKNNLIEKVPSDVFTGLYRLVNVYLGKTSSRN